MRNLSQLLTAHEFPSALDRIRRSFARQPDIQTCGASAIRHGLLLGGLTLPTATLEAILEIRNNEGTTTVALRACLRRLGLEARGIRKPARLSTADFFDRLRGEFARGSFLLPCIKGGMHWVCVGSWQDNRIGMVDSFFDRIKPSREAGQPLIPGLGFFHLSTQEFDALDWAHHVTIVRPGIWERSYRSWLAARSILLRLPMPRHADGTPVTVVDAIRLGAHQFLDDEDYNYRRLQLNLKGGHIVTVRADDKGGEPVGIETEGMGAGEMILVRRLGGILTETPAVPELVVRARGLRAAQLA